MGLRPPVADAVRQRPPPGNNPGEAMRAAGIVDVDYLARNHPFVDANKRTALMCALVFLGLNGERLRADPDDLYALVDGVAAREVDKAEVSVFLRRHCFAR